MAATARQIPVTDDDLDPESSGGGGGAYASLIVPEDYEGVLSEVSDYKTQNSNGWKFTYSVETPAGGSVSFNTYLAFSEAARWKLIQVLTAHGVDLSVGLNNVDPNILVGDVIGLHIDFPRDDDGEPTSKYREVREHFALGAIELDGTVVTPEVI